MAQAVHRRLGVSSARKRRTAHLPDQPSRADPPWLAMPIAVPIARALDDKPLPDIVAAVAAADTLARLQRDFDIAHRDIKPGNLYELDDSWLIGDFGLVALPGAEPLTAEGRQVGPARYTAYEMILNPATADLIRLTSTRWARRSGYWRPLRRGHLKGTNRWAHGASRLVTSGHIRGPVYLTRKWI